MTEPRLRTIVAIGQWSTSWIIAVALVCVILHITPPDWLTAATGLVFALAMPTFLIAGLILCVRLPGWRKWVALLANTFLVVAGVALMRFAVTSSERAAGLGELDRIHAGPIYVSTVKDVAEAQDTRSIWKRRAEGLDPTWVSAAQKPADQMKYWDGRVSELREELKKMDAGIIIPIASVSSATDLFGPGSSGVLELILMLSNEVIALCLMWRTRESAVPVHAEHTAPRVRISVPDALEAIIWTDEEAEYVAVMRKLIDAGERHLGFRSVAQAGGLNLGACRRIGALVTAKIEKLRFPEKIADTGLTNQTGGT